MNGNFPLEASDILKLFSFPLTPSRPFDKLRTDPPLSTGREGPGKKVLNIIKCINSQKTGKRVRSYQKKGPSFPRGLFIFNQLVKLVWSERVIQ